MKQKPPWFIKCRLLYTNMIWISYHYIIFLHLPQSYTFKVGNCLGVAKKRKKGRNLFWPHCKDSCWSQFGAQNDPLIVLIMLQSTSFLYCCYLSFTVIIRQQHHLQVSYAFCPLWLRADCHQWLPSPPLTPPLLPHTHFTRASPRKTWGQ